MNFAEHHHAVLDAAHKGDPDALEQLLALCQPDLRRYARRACMVSDVDDAVQEALLVLARRLQAVRELAAFSGWLFRIVQRECHRLGRRALPGDPFDDAGAERWLAAHDDVARRVEVVNALECLPRDYLHVILLRDIEGCSIAEIGQQLGVTPATARSRLHRARACLRELLVD